MKTLHVIFAVALPAICLAFSCRPKSQPAAEQATEQDTTLQQTTADEPEESSERTWASVKAALAAANEPWATQDTTGIMHQSPRQIMERILPEVSRYAASDSTEPFFNNVMQRRFPDVFAFREESAADATQQDLQIMIFDYDDPDMLAVGKFVDGRQVIAVTYDVAASQLVFFRLKDGQWQEVGRHKSTLGMPFGKIYFEELNGRPGLEIVLGTFPWNMNGNAWMECFVCSPGLQSIAYAGSFSTNYTIDPGRATLAEDYECSNSASPHKTLYTWHNDRLVPLRRAVIAVPADWDTNDNRTLEYYEAAQPGQPLKLQWKKIFDRMEGEPAEYWDDFFEREK